MQRKVASLSIALVLTLAGGLAAQKEATREMSPDQKVLHAISRLTFGARPGDVEAVRKIGLDQWIDQQLHPETIPENPVLESKLAPLDSLRMPTAEMLVSYPSPNMIKEMAEGRMDLPFDPETRAMVKLEIARYEANQKKKGGDQQQNTNPAAGDQATANPSGNQTPTGQPDADPQQEMRTLMAGLGLSPDQLRSLRQGSQQKRADALAALPPDIRRRYEILSAPAQVIPHDLDESKLLRAVYSNRQLEEVLTDFWYNHFNVFRNKGADKWYVTAYERDVIRPHVLGKFKDLLLATAESPAMMFYLDNWQSVSPEMPQNIGLQQKKGGKKAERGLNENYGRELMELQTLGVDGGYTQKDVTEVARCFTGWTIKQPQRGGGFQFNPRTHDMGEKHVLGVTIRAGDGMEDGLRVIDLLSRHVSTARFISKSLAIRFVSDDPPQSLVDRMAKTFLSTDGDLRAVMQTMLQSPEFWDQVNFRSKVKSPLELVVSAARSVDADVVTAMGMANLLNRLGEPLYMKQEPTGYSNRSADWMNSASLLERMNFANSLTAGRVPGIRIDAAQFSDDPAAVERGILLTEPSEAARQAIQAGLDAQKNERRKGPLTAGLTLASPDFQRR